MKYLAIVMLLSSSAMAAEQSLDKLMAEYELASERINECMVSIAEANRHENVWQNEKLSIGECKARAMELMAVGQKMLRYSNKKD